METLECTVSGGREVLQFSVLRGGLPHTPPLRLQGAKQKERAGKLDEPQGLDGGKETLTDTTGQRHTYELAATGEAHTEPMQMRARWGLAWREEHGHEPGSGL